MYSCLLVLLPHTAAVTKDGGQDSGLGRGIATPCRNVKPRLVCLSVRPSVKRVNCD